MSQKINLPEKWKKDPYWQQTFIGQKELFLTPEMRLNELGFTGEFIYKNS